jgi:AcrR family transcriptional regulator
MSGSTATRARIRDPEITRQAIVTAAKTLLAREGIDAINMSKVARRAGVNRGTAYLHFKDKESLITAALKQVSEDLCKSVFESEVDYSAATHENDVDRLYRIVESLAQFAIDNRELGEIWLAKIMTHEDLAQDPFWQKWSAVCEQYAASELSAKDVDVEVQSVIMLSAFFIWPAWINANELKPAARKREAARFTRAIIRMSVLGIFSADGFPEIFEYVKNRKNRK